MVVYASFWQNGRQLRCSCSQNPNGPWSIDMIYVLPKRGQTHSPKRSRNNTRALKVTGFWRFLEVFCPSWPAVWQRKVEDFESAFFFVETWVVLPCDFFIGKFAAELKRWAQNDDFWPPWMSHDESNSTLWFLTGAFILCHESFEMPTDSTKVSTVSLKASTWMVPVTWFDSYVLFPTKCIFRCLSRVCNSGEFADARCSKCNLNVAIGRWQK